MSPSATVAAEELRVSLDQLRPSPLNPRKASDPKKLEELTASVRTDGILQALLVRPLPSSAWRTPTTPVYEIVFGDRRYRAAKAAGLAEVPVKVRALTDAEVLEFQIVENDQREDVNPIDQAEGYRRLMKAAGIDADTLGQRIGKSRSYIYQRLKLGELSETGKQALRAGELTPSHAILLARLQPKDQAAALKATIREEEVRGRDDGESTRQRVKAACSVRELEAWIATNVHLDLTKAPFPTDDPKLLPSAGACGPCPKRAANLAHLEPELAAKRPDTCTDHVCYDAKVSRWLEARVTEAQEKTRAAGAPGAGRKVVRLSDEYAAETPNARGTKDWQRAPTGDCPTRALGVVVEARAGGYGDVRVKLGEIIPVCLAKAKRCEVHNPAPARGKRPETSYGAAERRRAAKAKAATEERWRILAAVQDALTGPLPRKALELVAVGFWDDVWHESRVRVARAMGWKSGEARVAAVQVPKLTDVALAQFLLALAVAKDLHVPSYGGGGTPARLLAAARLFKVNPRRIKSRADKAPTARRRARVLARSGQGTKAPLRATRTKPTKRVRKKKAASSKRKAAARAPTKKRRAAPSPKRRKTVLDQVAESAAAARKAREKKGR